MTKLSGIDRSTRIAFIAFIVVSIVGTILFFELIAPHIR